MPYKIKATLKSGRLAEREVKDYEQLLDRLYLDEEIYDNFTYIEIKEVKE